MSIRPIKQERHNDVFFVYKGYSSRVIFVWRGGEGVAKERDQEYGELPNAVFRFESGVQSRCWSLCNRAVLISSIEVEDKNLWKNENYRRECSLIYGDLQLGRHFLGLFSNYVRSGCNTDAFLFS